MIPIATSTNLSIEKTAQLLQSLVDLKNQQNLKLPDDLTKSVNALLNAQQSFVEEIDNFLHKENLYADGEDEMEYKTVKTIVDSFPEFLAAKNMWGYIPLHHAAEHTELNAPNKYIKLFIDVGCKHNIGGKDSRGGLLVPSDVEDIENVEDLPLDCIKDPQIFEMLRLMDPPLFNIEDVQKYYLTHKAINADSVYLETVKYLIDLDPSCVHQKDEDNRLPIHCLLEWNSLHDDDGVQDMMQYIIQLSLSCSSSNQTIGGIFTTMPIKNDFTINVMVKQAGIETTWDLIEKALSKHKNLDDLPCI